MKESCHRDPAHASEEDLVRLANGELAPAQAAAALAHLEACERCRTSLHEIRRAFEVYTQVRRAALDARVAPGGAARAELQRRLAQARGRSSSWLEGLALQPGRARWALGLATLLLAAAIATFAPADAPVGQGPPAKLDHRPFTPDPRLTPGVTAAVPRGGLCAADLAPSVDRALALEAFRLYGIAEPQPLAYEVDFLIPPELGGAMDVRNLWPQPYDVQPWNAHAKDALEDYLLRSVCDGRLDLETAQRDLAGGWVAAYRKHFRTPEPLVEHAGFLRDEPWQ